MTIEEAKALAQRVIDLDGADEEVSHSIIDQIMEAALRAILKDSEDTYALGLCLIAVEIRDTEIARGWGRWYA